MSLAQKSMLKTLAGAGVASAILMSASTAYAQAKPFADLAGVWSGNGTVTLESGASERLRCKATYAVSAEGNGLQQTLRCASDSYKFDLSSNVVARDGTVTGTWNEASRNVSGNIQGKVSGGKFDVVVTAPSFDANLSLTTRGSKQSVAITSKGEVRNVSITLSRS